MKKLKKKPSKLLKQALDDLEKTMQDPRYVIDFSIWHIPKIKGGQFKETQSEVCKVCLSGAVMAQSLGAPIRDYIEPSDFKDKTRKKLQAIDDFRSGEIRDALSNLDIEHPPGLPEAVQVNETSYCEFKKDMKRIIKELKKFGL